MPRTSEGRVLRLVRLTADSNPEVGDRDQAADDDAIAQNASSAAQNDGDDGDDGNPTQRLVES